MMLPTVRTLRTVTVTGVSECDRAMVGLEIKVMFAVFSKSRASRDG